MKLTMRMLNKMQQKRRERKPLSKHLITTPMASAPMPKRPPLEAINGRTDKACETFHHSLQTMRHPYDATSQIEIRDLWSHLLAGDSNIRLTMFNVWLPLFQQIEDDWELYTLGFLGFDSSAIAIRQIFYTTRIKSYKNERPL